MRKEERIKTGINIGKAGRKDRGITIYTRNILNEFGRETSNCRFVLLGIIILLGPQI